MQNRSHFVDSSTHKQFSTLDAWLEAHSSALFQVMEPGHVLFGEWLYAKHSIHYTRLPDYFLAFDLYDRRTGVFHSSAERDRLLKDTGIMTVRTIAAAASFSGRDDVRMHACWRIYGVAPRIVICGCPPPHTRLVIILRALFSCMLGCEALRHTLRLL